MALVYRHCSDSSTWVYKSIDFEIRAGISGSLGPIAYVDDQCVRTISGERFFDAIIHLSTVLIK